MPVYARVDAMPGCCGVRVFNSLCSTNPKNDNYVTAEDACKREGINTLLATTATGMRLIEDMLKEEGWERINIPEPNPNTGNTLTLWMYTNKDPFIREEDDDADWDEPDDDDYDD